MNISYRRVKALIVIAENGSFTRAAQVLNTSQPALSAHIRELEAALGMPLLNRTTRFVQLTPDGERFVIRAKRPIAELEALFTDMRDRAELRRGSVSFSCVAMIASHLLPGVIARFAEKYPGIKLEVLEHNSAEAEQAVLSDMVEFAVCGRTSRTGEFDYKTIARDHFMAVVRRDDPVGQRAFLNVTDLAGQNLILMRRGSNSRNALERATQLANVSLAPACEVTHHYSLASMVHAGLGIGVLPAMTVAGLGRNDLISVPIRPEIHREVVILRKRSSALTLAAAELAGAIEAAVPRKWRPQPANA